jgi:hypothetical protein
MLTVVDLHIGSATSLPLLRRQNLQWLQKSSHLSPSKSCQGNLLRLLQEVQIPHWPLPDRAELWKNEKRPMLWPESASLQRHKRKPSIQWTRHSKRRSCKPLLKRKRPGKHSKEQTWAMSTAIRFMPERLLSIRSSTPCQSMATTLQEPCNRWQVLHRLTNTQILRLTVNRFTPIPSRWLTLMEPCRNTLVHPCTTQCPGRLTSKPSTRANLRYILLILHRPIKPCASFDKRLPQEVLQDQAVWACPVDLLPRRHLLPVEATSMAQLLYRPTLSCGLLRRLQRYQAQVQPAPLERLLPATRTPPKPPSRSGQVYQSLDA